jgi:hypothetical protein
MGKVCGKLSGRECDVDQRSAPGAQLEDRRSKIEKSELRNRSLEAAQKRQELSAQTTEVRQFSQAKRPEDVADPKANNATLDEQGYTSIVALKSSATMKVFVTRLADGMGLTFLDEAKFSAWVPYFSGEKSTKAYGALVYELETMSTIPNHWCRRLGATEAAAPHEPLDDDANSLAHGLASLEQMSPEDRAIIESLIATGDVDPDQVQSWLKPNQPAVLSIIKEDATARARQMLLERMKTKGAIGPQDIHEVSGELKAQYGL